MRAFDEARTGTRTSRARTVARCEPESFPNGPFFPSTHMSLRDPNVVNPNRRSASPSSSLIPARSTTTGWPVGFWWSELTHPRLVFTEAGYEGRTFFSPDGGACEADAMSDPRDASGYPRPISSRWDS